MKEPRIQYAKTSDGVRIACTSIGEGKAFLLMPFPPMSWLAGWSSVAPLWTPLAESHRLVVYDPRGCGFSDRDALDFSMDAMLRDLDVVAAPLGSEPFALIAVTNAVHARWAGPSRLPLPTGDNLIALPRGAYGPQGSTCPPKRIGGLRAVRATASLASPAI